MDWWKDITLVHIWEGSIEEFSFLLWSVIIIFTIHHLEVILETLFNLFNNITLWGIWVNWLSSIPIILISLIEKTVVSHTITRCFIDIFKLIGVLVWSTSLIEELLVVCMIGFVVLAVCYIRTVVPRWNVLWSWHLNSFLKSIHFSLFWVMYKSFYILYLF